MSARIRFYPWQNLCRLSGALTAAVIFLSIMIIFQTAESATPSPKPASSSNDKAGKEGVSSVIRPSTAAVIAGAFSQEDGYGIIISALKNPSSDVRMRALEIIRERPARFPAEKVRALLNEDKDTDIKIQAAVTLAAMNDRTGANYLRSIAFNKPKLSSSPTVAERVKYFSAQNTRIKAIVNLGRIKDYASLNLLEGETKDEDGRVADAAWIALAYLGNKKGVDIFVDGLKNSDRSVRARAAEIVGDIGAADGIPLLRERLSDWDKDVRIAAIRSIGKLKDIQSAPKLREIIFSDKEQLSREAAARALGDIGDASPETISFLKRYLYDENVAVRLAVCHSLARLGDYSGKDFVKALAERGAEKEARYSAVKALEDFPLGSDEDKNFLSNLVYDEDPLTSLEALKILTFGVRKNSDFSVGKTTNTQRGAKK